MKKNFKWLLALVAMVASVNLMAETDSKTVTYSDLGIGNQKSVDGTAYDLGDYFSVTCTKGEASTVPTYYTSGSAVRCYATKNTSKGNVITITRTTDGAAVNAYITKVTYSGTHNKKGTTSFVYSGSPSSSDATSATYNSANKVTSASATLKETGNKENGQFYCTGVTVEYVYEASSAKTLESVTISGNPETDYETGESFDVTGLTVTGTYSDNSTDDVTDDAEWTIDPATFTSTSQTSVSVTAKVGEKSDTKNYNVTVTEHIVTPGTYEIVPNNTFFDVEIQTTGKHDPVSGKQNDITLNHSGGSNFYCNASQTRFYTDNTLQISVPVGYNISAISFTADGTNWVTDASKISANVGTMTDVKNWSGNANSVTITFGGTCRCTKITVTYAAPIKKSVTISSIDAATLKVNDQTGTISDVLKGTSMTLSYSQTEAQQHAYRFSAWNVTTEDGDVTVTDNKFEMPAKDVTVSATFTPLYAISVATAGEGSGTATINGGTETIYVGANDVINLVAEEGAGSVFAGWSVSDEEHIIVAEESELSTTAMAEVAGTITATFDKKSCTILGTPNVQVTDKTYFGAKLTWDAVANADYYEVYITKGAEEIESDLVEDAEYTISSTLDANTEYSYSIIATSEDEDTYCESNPAEDTFKTDDYPAATLTLSENGTTREVTGLKINTPFNLPDCSVTCDKVFVGWSESNENPTGLMAVDEEYTMTTTAVTLYAWFATETPGSTTWNKVSSASEISDGTIIALAGTDGEHGYYAAKAWESPNTNVKTISATVADNKLTAADPFAALTLKANVIDSKTYYTIYDGANYWYANGATLSSAKNQLVGHSTLGTDGRDYWEISFSNGTASIKNKVDGRGTMQFNYNGGSPIFSCYGSASQKAVVIFKKTVGASSYSDYSLTCSAKANAPIFDLAEGTYTEAKELNISAEEGAEIYYTLDGTEPDNTKTPYEGAIQLNTYGKVTVKAIAYVAEKDPSDVVTKEYMMNLPFTSLEQLAAANVQSGTEITITFPKTQIKSLAGTKGVYFNIQKEGKDIEIYCNSTACPDTYEAGGYLNTKSALTCKWVRYPETGNLTCWELTPSNWDAFEYSDPDPYTSVAELYAAGLEDGSKVYLNIANAYVHVKTYTNPNNFVYVQDGGVGIVLRTTETIADENVGKLMTAKIVGNLAYSNGRPQIAVTSLTDVSYTAGDRPAAVATTLSEGEEATQILSLVKIDGYYAQSQDKQAKTAVITENADGSGASYTIYNLFGALKTIPERDKAINVKGLFYKKVESNVTSYSIVPVLVEDVALVTPTAAPAASVNKGSEDDTNPTEVGNGEIITITPAAGFTASYILNDAAEKTITASEEKVTMTANSTLIIKSSRDYYAPTSKTYYYKINEALTYHSITKPIGNYTCELSAPSAKLNDEVTITFAMNEHWYLDGVTVKNAADKTVEFAATKVSDNKYSFAMPAYDVTLSTATHSDPTYSIDYQTGGKYTTGGTKPTEGSKYEGDEVTLQPNTWTVNDFVFDKWKVIYETGDAEPKEQHEVEVVNGKFRMPPYNVKVIAQWAAVYAVTYAKGTATSATGSVTEEPQKEGAVIKLKANAFKATGYSFTGWKASTDGEIYQPDADFTMPDQAVTFTAQWDEAAYLKEGTWELVTTESDIVADAYYVMAENVAGNVASYEFSGTSGKQYMQRLTVDEWTEKTILTKDQIPDKTAILKLTGTTGNWIFTCENNQKQMTIANNSDAGLSWTDAGTPLNIAKKVNSENNEMNIYVMHDKTEFHMLVNSSGGYKPYSSSAMAWPQLYRFYPKSWKVTFDDNVEDEEIAVPEMQRADPTNKVTISTDVPVRTGYTFSIWNSAKVGTGAISANPGQEIKLSKDITLYAQWNIKQYNVAVAEVENVTINAKPYGEADITEGTNADVNFKKSVVLTYKLNEDYVFKSWKVTKADDETTVVPVSVGASSTTFDVPAYDVKVSAIIESKATTQLTVTYRANGGKNKTEGDPDEVSEQVNWNTTIKFAEHPCPFEKNLCTFVGWNTKADGSGTTYKTQVTVKTDIDLYAMWQASAVEYVLDAKETTKVKVKDGVAPKDATAAYTTDYTTLGQLTNGKYGTLTLTGFAGKVITGVKMEMKTNKSGGAGTIVVKVGETEICSTSYSESFGGYSQSYIVADLKNFIPTIVNENEDITIKTVSSENSLYINGYTIEYEDIPEETTVRSGLIPGQYTTYCEPQTVLAGTYTGATFWNIESKTIMTTMGDERLSSITIVQHDGALVAGVPYIMLPEANELTGKKCSKAVAEPAAEDAHNGLVGVFATTMFDNFSGDAATIDALAAARGIYIISDGTLYLCGNNCGVYANRAYIVNGNITDQSAKAPAHAARRTIGNPNGTPTNLNGLNGNVKAQKALIDGHIYIIRENKMYNAQGLFVK